jgi:hypothetical protein
LHVTAFLFSRAKNKLRLSGDSLIPSRHERLDADSDESPQHILQLQSDCIYEGLEVVQTVVAISRATSSNALSIPRGSSANDTSLRIERSGYLKGKILGYFLSASR